MTAQKSFFDLPRNVLLQPIDDRYLDKFGVNLSVLRIDQINKHVSGNKWFKLKYNLEAVLSAGAEQVLSFGGAYSNHIHALAWAGKELGIKTVGVIRGEKEYADNPTLSDASKWGMELKFVDRQTYRQRGDPVFHHQLRRELGDFYLVPEGGSNAEAVKGCMEIVPSSVKENFSPTHIVAACGTGGTLSGIAVANPEVSVLGIPVLKNAGFLEGDIRELILAAGYVDPNNWHLDLAGHFGGYAKQSLELSEFCDDFASTHGILLDPVYTGKMMLRLWQLIGEGAFPIGSRIIAIHTGGLQGIRGMC